MNQRLVVETLSEINSYLVVGASRTEDFVVLPYSKLSVFPMGNQLKLERGMLLASRDTNQDKNLDVYLPFCGGQIGEMSQFIRYADEVLNVDLSRPHKAISPRKTGEMIEKFEGCFGGVVRVIGPQILLP